MRIAGAARTFLHFAAEVLCAWMEGGARLALGPGTQGAAAGWPGLRGDAALGSHAGLLPSSQPPRWVSSGSRGSSRQRFLSSQGTALAFWHPRSAWGEGIRPCCFGRGQLHGFAFCLSHWCRCWLAQAQLWGIPGCTAKGRRAAPFPRCSYNKCSSKTPTGHSFIQAMQNEYPRGTETAPARGTGFVCVCQN